MDIFLQAFKLIFTTKLYTVFYILIFAYAMLHGKTLGSDVTEHLKNFLFAGNKTVIDLTEESIAVNKLKQKYEEYYNCKGKYQVYCSLGFMSLIQFIVLLSTPDSDWLSMNVCVLTMIISFLEFRDNMLASKKLKSELDEASHKTNQDIAEVAVMALEDMGKEFLERSEREKNNTETETKEIDNKEK